MVKLGGNPELREASPDQSFITDNGNVVLDVHNLNILNPVELETKINQLAGVVTVGLFARRAADILVLGKSNGEVEILKA
eukprot:UN12479